MSTVAGDVDWLYYFIYWLSVVLFVAIVGAMVYFAWKYRERKGHKAEPTGHNLPLELAWTVAPIFILVFLFHKGFEGYMDMTVPPANAMEVRVNAKQWGWEFVYPNGGADNELHVPVHKPVKLVMASSDVIHSLFVPALRIKRDVVPGHLHDAVVRGDARRSGRHRLRRVLRRPQQGLERQRAALRADDGPLVDALDAPRRERGGLHEVPHRHRRPVRGLHGEGARRAPAAFSSAGREDLLEEGLHRLPHDDGRETRRALLEGDLGQGRVDRPRHRQGRRGLRPRIDPQPQAKIVTGFPPTMPSFSGQISDQEIDEVIAYIKSLKD